MLPPGDMARTRRWQVERPDQRPGRRTEGFASKRPKDQYSDRSQQRSRWHEIRGAPKMRTSQAIHEMADKGTAQTKQAYEKMSAATAETSSVKQNAGATATQGFNMDCNAKVIEFARVKSNAALDFVNLLLGVKSPAEFIQVSTDHARKQFDVLSAQTKELTVLSQKVMLETAEPLKAGAAKAFAGSHT